MASAAENLFCYPIAGFWVEIPEDHSRVDIYHLPGHDQHGNEGRPTPYPVKQLGPKLGDDGKISEPATLLAARVWCNHAADKIRNNFEPDFDGDGTAPLAALALASTAGGSEAAQEQTNAADATSVAQDPPAAKRRSKKG